MRAYYNNNTGHVVKLSEYKIDGIPFIEVQDTQYVLKNINRGLIPIVKDGALAFEADKAVMMKLVRSTRAKLLEEADIHENKIKDKAIISGLPVDQEVQKSIAIYRQALRDIVESSEIIWPQRPW